MKATCLVHIPVNRVELRQTEIGEPQAGQFLIETAFSCVSPGTELRCLRVEPVGEPYIPGYALAGRIIGRGPGGPDTHGDAEIEFADGSAVLVQGTRSSGDLKTHWGGHISHAIVNRADLCPVPEGVGLLEASLARLASISYHGFRQSRPLPSEQVAVVGLGIIGQFAARLHHLSGARVVAGDRSAFRVGVARSAGIEAVVAEGSLTKTFGKVMPQGADVIVDATGVAAVMPEAIELGKVIPWDNAPFTGVRYLVQGSYEADFTVPYNSAFSKEMSFLLTRSFQKRDALAVLDLLARKRLSVSDLATVYRPEQAAEAYAQLQTPDAPILTAAFNWR